MIKLTRLDKREFILNCDLIEYFESNPDTIVTLRSGKKMPVQESSEFILEKIISYKQEIYNVPVNIKDDRIEVFNEDSYSDWSDEELKKMIRDRQVKDIEDLDEEDDDNSF